MPSKIKLQKAAIKSQSSLLNIYPPFQMEKIQRRLSSAIRMLYLNRIEYKDTILLKNKDISARTYLIWLKTDGENTKEAFLSNSDVIFGVLTKTRSY